VVVNRWLTAPDRRFDQSALERLARGSPEERAAAACLDVIGRLARVAERQHDALSLLEREAPPIRTVLVPEMTVEAVDREALGHVADVVLGRTEGPIGRRPTLS
jgi:hypothetical protein